MNCKRPSYRAVSQQKQISNLVCRSTSNCLQGSSWIHGTTQAGRYLVHCILFAGLNFLHDTKCRQHIVPKLTFQDQLCELSPYVPRSTLEAHIPYTILRSIYHQLYGGSLLASEPAEQSPRQSPLISLAHASPSSARQNRPETTPRSHTFEPGYYSSSGSQHDDGYDADRRAGRLLRSLRRSGPLDFGASRKAKKFVEGSSSGSSHGAGSLQRFAVSRSGPLSYR
jgi:NCK-associated protein 1